MSSLKNQSIFLIIGNTFRQLSVIIQGMFLARLLTASDFGTFKQILLITTMTYTFSYLCLPESATYFLSHLNKKDRKIFLFQTVVLLLVLGVVAGLFLFKSANFFGVKFANAKLKDLLVLSASIPISMMFIILLNVSLITIKKGKLGSILSASFSAVNMLSIFLPLFFGMSFKNALGIYVLSYLAICVLCILLLWQIIGFEIGFDRKLIWEQINFSLPYWFGYGIYIFYTQSQQVLVSSSFSPEEFALFAVGTTRIPIIGQFSTYIALVLVPICVNHMKDNNIGEIIRLWEKSATKIAMIAIPVFMICVFSPGKILGVAFGANYSKAWPIFIFTAILFLFRICEIQSLFKISGKTKYVVYSTLTAFVVGLSSGYLLLQWIGLVGPAIGILLGRIAQIYVALLFINKSIPITFSQAFAVKNNSKIFFTAVISGIIAKVLVFWVSNNLLYIILNILIFGLCFLVLMRKFNLLMDEDIRLIKEWITLKPFLNKEDVKI
ncbi:MAG: polysaccharide biosynthesis C-terminal domain-containing protein [Planctomycetaceae bacterium]|nr:polysaccharide biosynthesis C-terminal domain-containing protein [Planctomycetaceae bacterium]